MRTSHIVSPSEQAISILKRIKEVSNGYELVLPGYHDPYKPTSENTINKAFHQMGYNMKQDACGHDFRAMTHSALMRPGLWSRDAMERQMNHQERNTVHLAHIHRVEYMEVRMDIMQQWLDYLDMCSEIWVPPYIWSQQNINLTITWLMNNLVENQAVSTNADAAFHPQTVFHSLSRPGHHSS